MNKIEAEAGAFVDQHVERVRPLFRESALASWHAATTGSDDAIEQSARARTAVKKAYSERESFQQVRAFLQSEEIFDRILHRQLVVLDQGYTANQLDPKTIEDLSYRESELEGTFYNFRAKLDGEDLNDNQLREILRTETDNALRRWAWEASKMIGNVIAPRLLELVRRRNAAARELGFANFYSMELALQEIGEEELFTLLDDFAARSEAPFRKMRGRIDSELAARYGVAVDQVRPWHWEDFFGQEAPRIGSLDLDPLFQNLEFEDFVRSYFADVGMPIEDVLPRSDLYEREGKDQHAFAIDVDREGDVRILCNLRKNEKWMVTLLHELGHAVYDKFLPRELPFLLRMPAHTLSTEAIAMFFGRLTRDPQWLRSRVGAELSPELESEVHDQRRISMLIATRWMLVMVFFERELYANPDRPDLGSYWWDLVERFQLVRRPEGRDAPDWATKIHLSIAPVYYHNYLLGELMASQLTHALGPAGENTPELGSFFRERVFAKGASLPWNELILEATGERLSSRYFVEQFIAEPLAGGA